MVRNLKALIFVSSLVCTFNGMYLLLNSIELGIFWIFGALSYLAMYFNFDNTKAKQYLVATLILGSFLTTISCWQLKIKNLDLWLLLTPIFASAWCSKKEIIYFSALSLTGFIILDISIYEYTSIISFFTKYCVLVLISLFSLMQYKREWELMQQRLKSEKMATIGLISASISHEVGNAIAQIGPAIELLETNHGTPEFEEYLPRFFRISKLGVAHATRIMHSLQLAAGDETQVVKFSLHEVVEDARSLCKSKLKGNIDFRNEVRKDVIATTSKVVVLQSLINLIVNAVQASVTHTAADNIETLEKMSTMLKAGKMQEFHKLIQNRNVVIIAKYESGKLSISDNGPGVPNEVREKLFKELFTTKKIGVGTGMGLYVSRQQLQKYGCDLILEPDTNNGSTFSIILGN